LKTILFYNSDNQQSPKQSNFRLAAVTKPSELEILLSEALSIKVVVEKRRKIFFPDTIKVLLDEVSG